MRHLSHLVVAAALLVTFAGGTADAGTKKGHASAKAAVPKCGKCGMKLSAKKTAAMPVAVTIAKKTWYCCSACGAHKKSAGSKKGTSEL